MRISKRRDARFHEARCAFLRGAMRVSMRRDAHFQEARCAFLRGAMRVSMRRDARLTSKKRRLERARASFCVSYPGISVVLVGFVFWEPGGSGDPVRVWRVSPGFETRPGSVSDPRLFWSIRIRSHGNCQYTLSEKFDDPECTDTGRSPSKKPANKNQVLSLIC